MNSQELKQVAAAVRRNFLPYAFTCECAGEDKSCAEALRDESNQIRYYQLINICRFIEEMDAKL